MVTMDVSMEGNCRIVISNPENVGIEGEKEGNEGGLSVAGKLG